MNHRPLPPNPPWSIKGQAMLPWLASVLTGLLLAASFPPLEWNQAAWIALVPLLVSVRFQPPSRAFKIGFFSGVVFWLFSIFWLTRVTIPGWMGLALYCALFLGGFAAISARCFQWLETERWWSSLGFIALATTAWTGLEYARSVLFTGFPWNPLGASQYRMLTVAQLADWGGVYAVSALVVWVNAAVALALLRYVDVNARKSRRVHTDLLLGLLAVVVSVNHGWRSLRAANVPTQPLRVALVQPNIPQEEKWVPETVDLIYERLRTLTSAALRVGTSDLIIWPETAVPDDVRNSEASYNLVREMATNGTPILVGSMDTEWRDNAKPRFFNSSFLFDADGIIAQVYDKRHLVIFGEYVPLQPFLPFVKALTPIEESFSPGSTSTVFRLEKTDIPFSVLICFEDTVASLARESVRNGARLLVNQTNDAWFDPSSASKQHMIQCVFRCIENRVPAIRSANTGVSCCINRHGEITKVLDDGQGNTHITGFATASVNVPLAQMPLTFYTRHGDVFARSCALFGVILIFFTFQRKR